MEKTNKNPLADNVANMLPLSKLNLDSRNPRFGIEKGGRNNQTDILDFIVENFGVEDVLSSLAYNGYFAAEPLIARKEKDETYTVVEGNRRLSACLILADSERAKHQKKLAIDYPEGLRKEWNDKKEIPVHIFEEGDKSLQLHAYLGVRHIMSAKAWDSYAKAAWIDEVISSGEMTIDQICQVTGDKNRTIQRLIEGFYFVNQLRDAGLFIPGNSLRKGRGSNPEFPFSWVYTLLDYGSVREWLNLSPDNPTNKKPIPQDKTTESAALISYMFGDKGAGRNPAIKDSRQLGALANAVADPSKREWLASGKTIEQIEVLSKAPIDQIAKALNEATESLALAIKIVSEGRLTKAEATQVLGRSKEAANSAANLFRTLRDMDEPELF